MHEAEIEKLKLQLKASNARADELAQMLDLEGITKDQKLMQ